MFYLLIPLIAIPVSSRLSQFPLLAPLSSFSPVLFQCVFSCCRAFGLLPSFSLHSSLLAPGGGLTNWILVFEERCPEEGSEQEKTRTALFQPPLLLGHLVLVETGHLHCAYLASTLNCLAAHLATASAQFVLKVPRYCPFIILSFLFRGGRVWKALINSLAGLSGKVLSFFL